jgi:DNA-binding XRE family transcriptional regulator
MPTGTPSTPATQLGARLLDLRRGCVDWTPELTPALAELLEFLKDNDHPAGLSKNAIATGLDIKSGAATQRLKQLRERNLVELIGAGRNVGYRASNFNGLTQWDLANKLNTRANRISDWETGRHEPTLPLLKRIADVYGMTVAELLDGVM